MDKQKTYLIYGKKVVQKIIESKPNMIKEIWIEKNKQDSLFIPKNISCRLTDKNKLDEITKENHQGYIAFMKDYNYVSFGEISNNDKILILDRIQDPHNFGAIIRSATLFGYKNIVVLDHNQCPVTPTVAKTSAGTIYEVSIAKVSNLSNAINVLKQNNHWIYTTYLSDNSVDLNTIKFDNRNAIVIGNEGEGVSNKIANISDFQIKIQTEDAIDSLNASVATGIILFFATLN